MQTVRDVAQRNHDVIASLMTRDYEGCVARSSKALEIIHGALRVPHDDSEDKACGVAAAARTHFAQNLRSIPLPVLPASSGVNEGAVEIFNRALAFECGHSRDRNQDVVLAATVLYNTALCHHVQSVEHAGCSFLLQKALRLYSMASSLLTSSGLMEEDRDDEMSDGLSGTEDIALLILALMNNMAHIHTCLMDLEHAWECLSAMNEEFDCMGENVLTDEEFMFFGMTSTLVPPRDSFVASPAA